RHRARTVGEEPADEGLVSGRYGHLRERRLGPLPRGERGPLVVGRRRRFARGGGGHGRGAASGRGQSERERLASARAPTSRGSKEVGGRRRPRARRCAVGARLLRLAVRTASALGGRRLAASLLPLAIPPVR